MFWYDLKLMARRTERQLVASLRERFRSGESTIQVGIGDDAAVLAGSAEAWVSSVDASVEGVHFDLGYLGLEDVGYRAFQAAASDLAAMGATPLGALSALILPRALGDEQIEQLTMGQALASRECQCPIVGGNVSRGSELSLTTTVMGRCVRPLCRGGARAGEEVWIVGSLGLAAAGLACLRLGLGKLPEERPTAASRRLAGQGEARRQAIRESIAAWRRPRALLQEGRELAQAASAGIDISDGLASDAAQLARASGVRIVIDREQLRAALDSPLLEASRALRCSPLHFALYGGEDYALLATGPRARCPEFARAIGHVARGAGAVLATPGILQPLERGFDHFRS